MSWWQNFSSQRLFEALFQRRPKGLSQQITTFVQTFLLFKLVPSPFWKMTKSILLFKYLNTLVRALITRTSSTWVYHTMPNMSYTLKTYVKLSTRVLPKDWTRDLETYSTALWPLGYSNWWLCPKSSNLWLMFVSVRDRYNFYIKSVYHQGLLSRKYSSCFPVGTADIFQLQRSQKLANRGKREKLRQFLHQSQWTILVEHLIKK